MCVCTSASTPVAAWCWWQESFSISLHLIHRGRVSELCPELTDLDSLANQLLQEFPVSAFWTLEFEADEPTWHLCGFWGEIQLWCLCLWTIPQPWCSLCEMVSYCAHSRDTAGPQEKVGTSGETGRQSEASHVLPLHIQVTSLCRPASSALQPTRHNTASQVCNLKS